MNPNGPLIGSGAALLRLGQRGAVDEPLAFHSACGCG
jgi:hypothetical protein